MPVYLFTYKSIHDKELIIRASNEREAYNLFETDINKDSSLSHISDLEIVETDSIPIL